MDTRLTMSLFRRPQWAVVYRYFGAKLRHALDAYMHKGDKEAMNILVRQAADFAMIFEADNRAFRRNVFFSSCIVAADLTGTFGLKTHEVQQAKSLIMTNFEEAYKDADLGKFVEDILGRVNCSPVPQRQADRIRLITELVGVGAGVQESNGALHITVATPEQHAAVTEVMKRHATAEVNANLHASYETPMPAAPSPVRDGKGRFVKKSA